MPSVIIFVEDPGAANYVAGFPIVLSRLGIDATIVTAGIAESYLAQRGADGVVTAGGLGAEEILDRFQPSLVVVGTSGNAETVGLELVRECSARKIPTVGVVDTSASAAHRFRGLSENPLAHAPDLLLVPDRWTATLYIELGYPRGQLVICGHPHYDYVRAAGTRLRPRAGGIRRSLYPDAPADSHVVVFAGEMTEGLDPREYRRSQSYTLFGYGESTTRGEVVLEEFLDAIALREPRPYCVLRIHPKNQAGDFAPYLAAFQQISRSENALEVIVGADAVVGMTTMLQVESVLLGTPTLSIIPRSLEKGWLVTTQLGLTPCATTREQVQTEIDRLLGNPAVPDRATVEDSLPSGALERATDAIRRLLETPSR